MLTAVTGINWGDEGKGRVIDLLAEHADVVVRYQGGNNAGHTVVTKQEKFVLNLLPSGILHPNVVCVLGDGMVIDLEHLTHEIEDIESRGISITPEHLKLSKRATISMPWHRIQDELEETRLEKSGAAFGSTRRGIAYAYSDKYRKKTLRLGDLLHLKEENVQVRIKTMLESKIWNWQAVIIRSRCLIRHCCPGVKNRLPFLRLISAIPEASWKMLLPAIKRWFWKPSLEPCVISIMVFSLTLQVPPPFPPMVRLEPVSRVNP